MATKEEIQSMVQQQGHTLTKEEVTQQLIDMQKSRITLLEGNISSILNLSALVITSLALLGGIIVWLVRRSFLSKLELVEAQLVEMKGIKDKTISKVESARELNNNLNLAIREAQDLHISLNKSKSDFDDKAKKIDRLWKYADFIELKGSRIEIIRAFEREVIKSKRLISGLEFLLKGNLPNYIEAHERATEIFGENVSVADPNETILEKLSFYKECLEDTENDFWEEAEIDLEWENYEDRETLEDPLYDIFKDWEGYFKRIKKFNDFIK